MKSKEKNKFRDVPVFNNIKEVIENSVKLYKNNVAFVTKIKKEDKSVEYINHTYQNLLDDINSFGTSLYKLGLKGKRIAICGRNRYEWVVAHLSNLFGGIVSVPIDKELQLNELEDSLVRSKADAIVFDEKYEENISIIKQNGRTNIHNFICMSNIDGYAKFEDLLKDGKKEVQNGTDEFIKNKVNSETMSILLFTSGTTSKSKAVMLNQKAIAANIAEKVGVDEYYSEVLPEDKAKFVENEKNAGRKVIMIGDGINDSPALSEANVGIAISDGAEIAREIADVTISADDLYEIATLKQLSDAMVRRINTNYRLIVGINTGLIVLGIAGVFQPTMSALFHNTSTILISLKSMNNLLDQEPVEEIK